MNKKTVFLNLALLFIMLVTGALTYWVISKDNTVQHIVKADNPDAILVNATYIQMDKDGSPHYIMSTPHLTHYAEKDRSEFIKPDITIINVNAEPYRVTANKGNSEHGTEIAHLIGSVKLHQKADKQNKELTILTSRATIYLDPNLHKALKLKAIETSRSISDLVNSAVRDALAEDAEDIAAFDNRAGEALISYDEMVKRLKKDGRI